MSDESPHSEWPAPAPAPPRRRGLRPRAVVFGVLVVGLVVWIGARVSASVKSRAQMAAEGQRSAEAARAALAASVATGEAAARPVESVQPERYTWRPSVPFEGTLQPIQEADLGFKAGGKLARLHVRVGDRVRSGATLAALQTTEAAAQVRAAAAQVRAGQAQLALAADASKRTEQLVGVNATPQATGVQAAGQRALALAQLESARAQLALARTALANHRLTAPFAGSITRVPSGIGAVVGAGTSLFHIADTSRLKLAGTLAEADALLVHPGDEVELRLDDGRSARGAITAVLPSVDPATRRVPVEAALVNGGAPPLLAGTFVRAVARARQSITGVRLPPTVLRSGSQDEVFQIQSGRAALRRVAFTLEAGAAGGLLVRAGLQPGDQLVRTPPADLTDGQAIRVVAPAGSKGDAVPLAPAAADPVGR